MTSWKTTSVASALLIGLVAPSPTLQAQPGRGLTPFPIPMRIEGDRFIHSGLYLHMSVTEVRQPIRAIMNAPVIRDSPRGALADILRSVRDGDGDVFASRMDREGGTDATLVFGLFSKWLSKPEGVFLEQTLEVGGLTYFILRGTVVQVPGIPIPIVERNGMFVMSWKLLGHPIVQNLNEWITMRTAPPAVFSQQPEPFEAREVVVPDPFDVDSPASAHFLVTGSSMSAPIFGTHAKPTWVPDEVSKGALSFYKDSCKAFHTKDRDRYISMMNEKSGRGEARHWERMEDAGVLDEYVRDRTRNLRLVAFMSARPATIFFKVSGLGGFNGQYDVVLERPDGGFERVNVRYHGPLRHLLGWDNFREAFKAAVIDAPREE